MSFLAQIQANIDNFTRNLDKAQARLDVFSDTVGKKVAALGSKFQVAGGVMSLGITAPLAAIGTAAFDMAADFEDALGATDQTFQRSAKNVQEWADNLPTYFGIAKKEALEYSNMMGSMLKNIGGLTDEEASKQSAKLIELAGDLTAMYGGTTQDAVRALTGALKGNNTMLDNYGMAANDALVKAKALSLGLVQQGKEMSLTAKQTATLALIYEQSGAAQGQAAREADGASGSMRALRTTITNLTTEIGNVLLPIITPLISKLRDIVSGFQTMTPETKRLIVVIGGLAAAIGPLLVILGSLMQLAPLVGTAFAVMTGPIGIAIAGIVAGAALIYQNWSQIKEYFTTGAGSNIWGGIVKGATDLWDKISTIFNKIKPFITELWNAIGYDVERIFSISFGAVLSIVEGVIGAISGILDVFSALIKGDFSGAIEGVKKIFLSVFTAINNIVNSVLAEISQRVAGFLKLIGADSLGASLSNWASGLTYVAQKSQNIIDVELPRHLRMTKEELDAFNKSNEEYAKLSDKATGKTKDLGGAIKEVKNDTRDYKSELVNLFADWGVYESQITAITKKFADYSVMAKKAGATTKELDLISRKELGEKLSLALNQFDLKEVRPKLKVNPDIEFDIDTITEKLKKLGYKIVKDLGPIKEEIAKVFNVDIGAALGEMAGNAIESLGTALANGTNVVDAICKSLLSTLGSLAVNMGKQMIAFGAAALGLQKLLTNPYTAIAAGAALIALGSFASASVSKTVSSATSGGGSSYSSATTGTDFSQFRGALYNNDKQVVQLELRNSKLVGAVTLENKRNNRLG